MNEPIESGISSYGKLVSLSSSDNSYSYLQELKEHIKLKRCAIEILKKLGLDAHSEVHFEKGIADCAGENKNFSIAIECGGLDTAKFIAMTRYFDFVIHMPYSREAYRFLLGCTLSYRENGSIISIELDPENYCSQITNLMTSLKKTDVGSKSIVFREELQIELVELKSQEKKLQFELNQKIADEKQLQDEYDELAKSRYESNWCTHVLHDLDSPLKHILFLLWKLRVDMIENKDFSAKYCKSIDFIYDWLRYNVLHPNGYKRNSKIMAAMEKEKFDNWHQLVFEDSATIQDLVKLHSPPEPV